MANITGTTGNDSVTIDASGGTLASNVTITATGAVTLTSGAQVNDIALAAGDDYISITNASTTNTSIAGSIGLGAGNDTLVATSSRVSGVVDGGGGNNFFTLTSVTVNNNVNLGSDNGANHAIQITNSSIQSNLTESGNSANTTVGISGSTIGQAVSMNSTVGSSVTIGTSSVGTNVSLGSGNDSVTITQSTVAGQILTGAGNDYVSLGTVGMTGSSISAIQLGTGNDTLVGTSVKVSGAYDAGTGSNQLTLTSSTIAGNLNMGSADATASNSVVLNASSIGGQINAGATSLANVQITGSTVGTGIASSATASTSISIGTSSLAGNIVTGSGGDTVSIANTTLNNTAIQTGAGADRVDLLNVSTVGATSINSIDLGTGADTLLGTNIRVQNGITAGTGSNQITLNSATVGGNVTMGDNDATASNTLALSGSSITGQIIAGSTSIANVQITGSTVGAGIASSATTSTSISMGTSSLAGNIVTGNGADTVSIANTTLNNTAIQTGAGNDSVDLLNVSTVGATSINSINLGTGADTLLGTNIRVQGGIDGGTGNNQITLNSATIGGNIVYVGGDSGANTTLVLNDSSIGGNIDNATASSLAHFTITNSTISGTAGLRAEDATGSTMTISGSSINGPIEAAGTGAGTDSIYVTDSTITGGVTMNAGNDSLTLENTRVGGNIDGGTGNNQITVSDSTITGNVFYNYWGGSATLAIVNGSSIGGFVDNGEPSSSASILISDSTVSGNAFGYGVHAEDATISNMQIINSSITSGVRSSTGADTVVISESTVGGVVDLGNGADYLKIDNSNVNNAIQSGDGNDTVRIHSGSTITGTLAGNNGIDSLQLGGQWTITLANAATLSGGGTTTTVTNLTAGNVIGWNGGQITGTVSLGGSGDTFAVNTFEQLESVPCFASGSMIETDQGECAVEDLDVGMMVQTADHGLVAIDWIGSRMFGPADLARMPELRPIRIKAGALGKNIPADDLLVSPQHRMVLRSRISQRMFADQEVFVAAKHLVGLPGVEIAEDVETVTYWHVMFRQHEVIFANGAPTESLHLGKEALKTLTGDQLDEIRAILPEIFGADFEVTVARSALARRAVSGRLARKFVERTSKASKPAVEPPNKSGPSARPAIN